MSDVTLIVIIPPRPITVVRPQSIPALIKVGVQGPPGSGQKMKQGVVAGASFSGSPKKFAVVFASAMPDATYAISIVGQDDRAFSYESKSAAGFTINSNASVALAGEVSWMAIPSGET